MTAIHPGASPCRAHPCSVEHADVVLSFRDVARTWAETAERVTGGYEADLAAYRESAPPPSFRDHLISTARERAAAQRDTEA